MQDDMQRGKHTKAEKPSKTTRCKRHAKGREDGFDKSSKNHTMQAYAKGKENQHGKPRENGRCKAQNWEIGVRQHAQVSKHVSEAIKREK